MIVGVTGKYCSGKNRLTSILTRMGFFSIDVDKIGHKILEEKKDEITKEFGNSILNPDNTVNRKNLGKQVFNNRSKLETLEKILHPSMIDEVKNTVKGKDKVVINAAVLFSMGLNEICDYIFIVKSPLISRIWRGMKRDSLSTFQILKRICTQRKLYSKLSINPVDIHTITNIGSSSEMETDVRKIIEEKG